MIVYLGILEYNERIKFMNGGYRKRKEIES